MCLLSASTAFGLSVGIAFGGESGEVSGTGKVDPRAGQAKDYYMADLATLTPSLGSYKNKDKQPIRYIIVSPPRRSGKAGKLLADFVVECADGGTGIYGAKTSVIDSEGYFFAAGNYYAKYTGNNSPTWSMYFPSFRGFKVLELDSLRIETLTVRNKTVAGFGKFKDFKSTWPYGIGIGGDGDLYKWDYTASKWPSGNATALVSHKTSWGGPLKTMSNGSIRKTDADGKGRYDFPAKSNFPGWEVGGYTLVSAGSGDGFEIGHAGVVRVTFGGLFDDEDEVLEGSCLVSGDILQGYKGSVPVNFEVEKVLK